MSEADALRDWNDRGHYIKAWKRVLWDATGDQTKVDRTIQLAEIAGLFVDGGRAKDQEYAETMRNVAQQLRMVAALESIAGWGDVNLQREYEPALRDIIRSVADCAAAALEAAPMSPTGDVCRLGDALCSCANQAERRACHNSSPLPPAHQTPIENKGGGQ